MKRDLNKIDNNVIQYLETALWSSTDDNDDPLDDNYGLDDIDSKSIELAQKDWNDFVTKAGNLLDDLDLTNVAHDFWLTRNRHGAGFWDRDYKKKIGKKLTDLAHGFGTIDLYVGDDGILYFSR